jgi:hypothetical protein
MYALRQAIEVLKYMGIGEAKYPSAQMISRMADLAVTVYELIRVNERSRAR